MVVLKTCYINSQKAKLSIANTYEHNLLERFVVDRHLCHMAAKFGVFVDEDHRKLLTLYCLQTNKSRFITIVFPEFK